VYCRRIMLSSNQDIFCQLLSLYLRHKETRVLPLTITFSVFETVIHLCSQAACIFPRVNLHGTTCKYHVRCDGACSVGNRLWAGSFGNTLSDYQYYVTNVLSYSFNWTAFTHLWLLTNPAVVISLTPTPKITEHKLQVYSIVQSSLQ